MADNKNDQDPYEDEYQFSSDLDTYNPEEVSDNAENQAKSAPAAMQTNNANSTRRKALIVIGVFLLLVLGYQLLHSILNKKQAPASDIQSQAIVLPPAKTIASVNVVPVVKPAMPMVEPATKPDEKVSEVAQKLNSVEQIQQNMNYTVSNVNTQLTDLNANIKDLGPKVDELKQMVTNLMAKVEEQENRIALLTMRPKHRAVTAPVKKVLKQHLTYYINAIIPGRAWLIASNGSSLTVSRGSDVPGYGIVRTIDSRQGKVMTSSGRIIKFSQQDS